MNWGAPSSILSRMKIWQGLSPQQHSSKSTKNVRGSVLFPQALPLSPYAFDALKVTYASLLTAHSQLKNGRILMDERSFFAHGAFVDCGKNCNKFFTRQGRQSKRYATKPQGMSRHFCSSTRLANADTV